MVRLTISSQRETEAWMASFGDGFGKSVRTFAAAVVL